jgi:hypothetical protein
VQEHVLDLLAEVGTSGPHFTGILVEQVGRQRLTGHDPVGARVGLQGSHRGDDHRGVGDQARHPALDVEEPLRAHVGAESGLGDQEVAGADADEVGHDR